ncbi:MAG: hypothetical protein J7619_07470 [Dyadobacter sp.]|uniref:hypothetical protein n=1 Tax=Dyadobacter sp. TaxID=1914288 RepID=UPI001AFE07B2|nr:hypothetical protein [Dyadobacter sp.]MBO9612516.1 hypothetical protein [Dyadobacter sp.]
MNTSSNQPDKHKWYNQIWLVVLLVFVFPPAGFYGLYKMRVLPESIRALIGIAYIAILVWVASKNQQSPYQFSDSGSKAPISNAGLDTTISAADTTLLEISDWLYSDDVDRMTSKKRYFANTFATEEINFDFPYDGGTTFGLIVRHSDGQNDVMLRCDKCQFIYRIGEANRLKVKFDEGAPETFVFHETDNGSSELIFIASADEFISRMKKSKHLLIGAEFYEAGTKYIDFDISGLKWDH